jgi:hypothetical protein
MKQKQELSDTPIFDEVDPDVGAGGEALGRSHPKDDFR